MNKLICLIYSSLFFFLYGTSQDSVSFYMHYLPMHKYDLIVSQESKVTTTYNGNDSIIAILKNKGVNNPTITNNQVYGASTTTTGELSKSKMPIKLIYTELKDGNNNILIPAGSGFSGSVEKDKMPVFDSILLKDENDTKTKTVLNQIKNILSQIHLPDKKMKLGDEYVYTTPVNIPIASTTMKMEITVIYKLNQVTDSIAGFDLTMKVSFDINLAASEKSRGTGSGYGTMVYDRLNGFPIKEELHYNMEMGYNMNNVDLKVEIISNSKHNIVISKL